MGGVWVMDLREGGSGTDRCLGEKRKEQKKEKTHPVLWLVHILDISSGYFNLPSN